MMERKERKPYWRHTKWQMLASVVPFLVLIIVLPLYAESLNTERFLGFPLGYFLSAHGIALVAIFTVGSFVNRQDAIDHWHVLTAGYRPIREWSAVARQRAARGAAGIG